MKKTIMIINHHAVTPKVGGSSRHYELAKELVQRGYNVILVASSNNFSTHKFYFSEEYVVDREDGITVLWIKTKPLCTNILYRFVNYIDFYRKVKKYYKLVDKPDVVIGSSVHPLTWLAANYICNKTKAESIAEIRDIWPLSMKEDLGKAYFIARLVFEPIERYAYNHAKYIVTTMPFANEHIQSLIGRSDHTVWIPHGIDIDKFDRNVADLDDQIPLNIKSFISDGDCCIYTGLLSSSEGLQYLLEAAKRLAEEGDRTKFAIIGAGAEKAKLEKMIEDHHLVNVKLLGRVDSNLVAPILKYAKVLFCGLADKEAFKYGISKNKFYDYFASGKPVIFASNVRDSVIDRAKAGFTVPAESPEMIMEAIRKINRLNDEERTELGKNGRDYVVKFHDNSVICDKFENLFIGE